MNMNILEQEDLIKGAPDDLLLQEAQSPTGRVPQFLVVSEIQRRKSMRDRFSAQEQQPEQSVAEQIVAGAASQMPPQGIGALQPQMPPPPLPQMPQQAPVMAMPPPQMPPEMMAAQNAPMAPPPQMMAAGGGRMPYQRMNHGGVIPPNALVEDASKFDSESLNDMRDSEKGWGSPTDMGIPRVIREAAAFSARDAANIGNIGFDGKNITGRGSFMFPNGFELGASGYAGSDGFGITGLDAFKELQNNRFIRGQADPLNKSFGLQFGGSFPGLNQGGLVKMAEGGSTTYQAMKDDALSLSSSVLGKGEDLVDQVINFYSEEDGTTDWGKVATHIAYTGLTFTPVGLAARGAQLGVGIGKLLTGKAGQTIASNLAKKIGQKLGHKIPANATLKAKTSAKLIANNPQIARELAVQSTKAAAGKGMGAVGTAVGNAPTSIGRGLAGAVTKYPKITRTIAGSMILDDILDPRTDPVGSITEEVIGKDAADQAAKIEKRAKLEALARSLADTTNMADGGEVISDPFSSMTDDQLKEFIASKTVDAGTDNVVFDGVVPDADVFVSGSGNNLIPTITAQNNQTNEAEVKPYIGMGAVINDDQLDIAEADADADALKLINLRKFYSDNAGVSVNPSNNTNQQLLDMMAESRGNIKDISSRFKDIKGPDYETLKAGIKEGVDEDVLSSILMSMAKSIYEGKGLAGVDVSGAQKIRQRAKDAMNAITLAESRGASEKELADLNRELQTEISLMAPFSALQAAPKRAMTILEKYQNLRNQYPEGTQEREELEKKIALMTNPSTGDIVAGIINKMDIGVEKYNPETGESETVYGNDALSDTDIAVLDKARQTGLFEQVTRGVNVNEFVSAD